MTADLPRWDGTTRWCECYNIIQYLKCVRILNENYLLLVYVVADLFVVWCSLTVIIVRQFFLTRRRELASKPLDNDLRNCPALTDNKRIRTFTYNLKDRKSPNNLVLATVKETMAIAIRLCVHGQTRLQKVICSGTGAYKWHRPICSSLQRMIGLMPGDGGSIDPDNSYTMCSNFYRRSANCWRHIWPFQRQSRWFKLTGDR